MKKIKKTIKTFLIRIKRYFQVKNEEYQYKSLNDLKNYQIKEKKYMLDDKYSDHPYDAHYIYHPAWAIRVLKEINPKKHVDISSIMSFSTMASAFFKIDYYDFRAPNVLLDNMNFKSADLTNLPFESESIESLSCMHTIEHIGLGRYGDSINPEGDKIAISEIQRVVKKNGDILFVVPIGKPRVVFNAHRVYKYSDIIAFFSECRLNSFSVILDNHTGGLMQNVDEEELDRQNYACGCFWFKKR